MLTQMSSICFFIPDGAQVLGGGGSIIDAARRIKGVGEEWQGRGSPEL